MASPSQGLSGKTDEYDGDRLPMPELHQLQCLLEQVRETQTELLNNQDSMRSMIQAMMNSLNGHSMTGHGSHVSGTPGGHASVAEQAHELITSKVCNLKQPVVHRVEPQSARQQQQKSDYGKLLQRERKHLVNFCRGHSHRHSTCLERLVESGAFEVACSMVILLHTIVAGIAADCEMHQATHAVQSGAELRNCNPPVVEISFWAFYTLELGLKLAAWRCTFFTRNGWHSNVFDLLLVCSGTIYLADFTSGENIMWLRIIRLTRQSARALRIFRFVEFCAELRVLMISIGRSLNALFWALVTLSMLMYMCSILFVSGVASYLASDPEIDEELKQVALADWGSIPDAMITLFRSVTGGGPWGHVVPTLRMAGEFYHVLFLLYIAVLSIAVLKLLTGVFIQHAAAASSLDHEQCIVRSIRDLFQEIDTDGSGTITLEEFVNHIKDPVAVAYLGTLNIDVVDAEKLFHLIDDAGNGNGLVDITEFIEGCRSYKGYAKKLDVSLIMNQISCLAKAVEMCLDHVIDLHHAKARQSRAMSL